jgi:GDSL-like Lipase/Acylhydrolase family
VKLHGSFATTLPAQRRDFCRNEALKKSGVKDLYYIPGEHLLGDDGEGSMDGSHSTDLGSMRQAEIFAKCPARC